MEVIQCNTEVALEHWGSGKFVHQMKKMADSRFALSNQNIVEKLAKNTKTKNKLKATQTWLNVLVTERKVNPKTEEFENEYLEEESATE